MSNKKKNGKPAAAAAPAASKGEGNGESPEVTGLGDQGLWVTLSSTEINSTTRQATSVMALKGGCIVRVNSESPGGNTESMLYVPGAKLVTTQDEEGNETGHKLI